MFFDIEKKFFFVLDNIENFGFSNVYIISGPIFLPHDFWATGKN